MRTITICIDIVDIEISPSSNNNMQAQIEINKSDIYNFLTELDISDIIDHYGYEKLLEGIGIDEAKKHFEL